MLTPTSRRSFLGVAATAGLVLAQVTGRSRPAESSAPVDEILVAGTFKVDIEGCGGATAAVDSVEVEEITIDARETTTGLDVDYRRFSPGDVRVGPVTLTIPDNAPCQDVRRWLLDAAAGKVVRKNITVILYGDDGAEARRWNLLACAPEKLASAPRRCQGAAALALVARPLRVELVPTAPAVFDAPRPAACGGRSLPPQLAQRLRREGQRWAVRATDAKTRATSSWSGVSDFVPKLPVKLDLTASPNDPFRGVPYIEEITLRGPMTAQRGHWVQQAVSAAGPGQAPRFDLTIVEILKDGSDGKQYNYLNCFATGYVFPHLSAEGTGNLYEEVSLKPERLDLA